MKKIKKGPKPSLRSRKGTLTWERNFFSPKRVLFGESNQEGGPKKKKKYSARTPVYLTRSLVGLEKERKGSALGFKKEKI